MNACIYCKWEKECDKVEGGEHSYEPKERCEK